MAAVPCSDWEISWLLVINVTSLALNQMLNKLVVRRVRSD